VPRVTAPPVSAMLAARIPTRLLILDIFVFPS
jgi:hypothetical protein